MDTDEGREDSEQSDAAGEEEPDVDIDVPGADVEIRRDEETGETDVDVKTPEEAEARNDQP